MQWEPTGSVRAAVTGLQRRVKWVSKEKLDTRRRERRYLRCGKSGHRKIECSYLPARSLRYFNSVPRLSPIPGNPPAGLAGLTSTVLSNVIPSGPHRHAGQVNTTKIKKEERNTSGTESGVDTDSEKE